MKEIVNIVILAAGKGTRMYSKLPKVLHRIGGKSMLEHVVDTAETLMPKGIYVVVGHGKDSVMTELAHKQVVWVEQAEQLGTGHALKMALPHLSEDGRTLVLYGDVPLIDTETLKQLLAVAGDEAALLIDRVDDPTGYGRIIRDNGLVSAIVEEKDADVTQKNIKEINTGIFVLPNRFLHAWLKALQSNNAQGEYYLTDVVALAKRDGVAVHSVSVRDSYLAAGVNNKVQLAQLERIFQHNQAKQLMAAGVTLHDPSRFDLRGTVHHGQDVVIDVGCILIGDCVLGDDVSIGAHCVLINAHIGAGTVIAPFSHLENCTVGAEAHIGPYARLRPHAMLDDGVHIGNFVEVKNSIIGKGSKANHLTYIGDAKIGHGSNIGAGTITCNYDGVHKHKTVIGNDVRIGSGTMIVAPVEIQDRATTGAGSVITKTCPANKLTLARSRQQTIDNWERPEKDAK